MDICGEHGDEIAYAGRNCPACDQVEQLQKDHQATVNDLEQQISEGDEKIGELEAALEEARSGT